MPSLAQLDEAVRAWLAENPDDEVIVVVDASFSYRIDESERKMFEEAEEAGEVVSPPAGALGRGDGFLLRIADRVDAAVLSNDSFQEFHGEYKWLFDSGRLLGGKPVPGVGWIFTPRTPVRGPKSRMAVRDAQRATKSPRSAPVVKAIAQAKAEAIEVPERTGARRNRRRGGRGADAGPVSSHEAINEPLPFVTFIAEHPLGTEVEGTVASFTSHGAFVDANGARCYVPVVGLGDPPPRTAKALLKSGETRTFVVQALDPPRRGIELALPGLARVAGAPTEETVEAEIDAGDARRAAPRRAASRRSAPGIPPPPRGPKSPSGGVPGPSGLPSGGRSRARPRVEAEAEAEAGVGVGVGVDVEVPTAPVEAGTEPPPRAPRRSPRRSGAARPGDEAAAAATATPEPVTARRSRRTATPAAQAELVAPASAAGEAASTPPARTRRRAKKASPVTDTPLPPIDSGALLAETVEMAPARPGRTARKAAKAPPAVVTGAAEKAPAEKAPVNKVGGSKAAVKKAPAKKAPAKKAAAGEASPAKKAAVKKGPAKKAAAKKATPAQATGKKTAPTGAPADKPTAPAAPARRARRPRP